MAMDQQDDIQDFEEYLQYVEAVEDMPASRVYIRNGENPFTMLTDGAFKKRYRFTKEIVRVEIIPLVLPGLGIRHNQRGLPVVCGPNLEFLNIVTRWPGSAHDNRNFENSGVMVSFEERRRSGILLGDSGYGQKPHLFTPVPNPQNEAENRYNRAHVKTRNIVERSFGASPRN
ncbi:hypothetical protein C0J52_02432 [Blattella germanica]|nr:hypothetical protein C0J52_02432 [Blattella germanica]